MFVDTHCHIDFDDFDHDRDALLAHLLGGPIDKTNSEKGDEKSSEKSPHVLSGLIIPGVYNSRWAGCLELANRYENIYTSMGIHPWFVSKNTHSLSGLFDLLVKNLDSPKCVAVGECGLDKTISTALQLQQDVFAVHLEVAKVLCLPLIIHATKAHNEVIEQIKSSHGSYGNSSYGNSSNGNSSNGNSSNGNSLHGKSSFGSSKDFSGVIHGFSGSYQLAKTYVDMGFCIGVGGTITYERAQKTRDAISRLPLDSIVLETDAPNMPLSGRQGQRNSPVYLIEVAQVLADLHHVSLETIAEQTTANASKVFGVEFN